MTGIERVRAALAELGSDCQVVELPDSTRTAADAAGTPHAVFKTSATELERATKARVNQAGS